MLPRFLISADPNMGLVWIGGAVGGLRPLGRVGRFMAACCMSGSALSAEVLAAWTRTGAGFGTEAAGVAAPTLEEGVVGVTLMNTEAFCGEGVILGGRALPLILPIDLDNLAINWSHCAAC
jgi:hypothetical protein